MFDDSKSYKTLFFCSVIHIAISISSALFGKIEGGEFFFAIPEYLVGAGYILSLIFAVHDDYYDESYKHTITVICVSLILKIAMAFLAQVGVWVLLTVALLGILFCAFGGTSTYIFVTITSFFGVWGTILGAIVAVAAMIAATMVW